MTHEYLVQEEGCRLSRYFGYSGDVCPWYAGE